LRRKHREQVDFDLNKGVFTKAVKVPPLGFAVLSGEGMASSADKVVIEPLDVDNYDTCWIVRATRTPETFQRSIIFGAKL
jgi:hypothetical protein